MSFFELDGGAKKKAKKSTKPKATKSKKSPTKKTKKGGNFLGTVSELFAPAGWENFVTAAGLLALDRTDNYLRKSKDSKKQKGGVDAVMMEEEMTGGARKRSSSRKQRGGSDGHHTIEALDAMMGSEEQDMTVQTDTISQTGGAKKVSKSKSKRKAIKQKGGMTDQEKIDFLEEYSKQLTQNLKNTFLAQYQENPEAMGLVTAYNRINKNNFPYNQGSNRNKEHQMINKAIQNQQASMGQSVNNSGQIANNSGQIENNSGQIENNSGQIENNSRQIANNSGLSATQPAQTQSLFSGIGFGGKKSKSKAKKPKSKAKKPKSKAKKPKSKKAPKKK
jgi:hypothetical protein